MAEKKKVYYQYLKYSAIGIEMAASVAVGGFIGYWLDEWLGTDPWFLIFWLFCGFVSGFRSLVRLSKKYIKESQDD
ncbi:MAG: AtpZ/AtpI family protein [Deltaproteobacteria bacterium]|nr:AtpZ/AtpI family protein [Deltaproteobacteria bacterium]